MSAVCFLLDTDHTMYRLPHLTLLKQIDHNVALDFHPSKDLLASIHLIPHQSLTLLTKEYINPVRNSSFGTWKVVYFDPSQQGIQIELTHPHHPTQVLVVPPSTQIKGQIGSIVDVYHIWGSGDTEALMELQGPIQMDPMVDSWNEWFSDPQTVLKINLGHVE